MFRPLHPGIKILSLILFAAGLPFASVVGLMGFSFVLGCAMLMGGSTQLQLALSILRRMRWLLLSLLVLYGWYTPGAPLIEFLGDWSPSAEGVRLGLIRIVSLLLIGLAVAWLLASTMMTDLIAGLIWFLAPGRWIGLPLDRLALRIALTMQAVGELREQPVSAPEGPSYSKIRILAETLFVRYEEVLYRAEQMAPQIIEVVLCGTPAWYHWFFPVSVGLWLVLV